MNWLWIIGGGIVLGYVIEFVVWQITGWEPYPSCHIEIDCGQEK